MRIFLIAFTIAFVFSANLAHATFVHAVGWNYMIREWVKNDMNADLIEITPLYDYTYRVVYKKKDADKSVTVYVDTNGFVDWKPKLITK